MPKLDGKVLITGASGFIGSRLRDELLATGSDVVAIRRPGSPPSKVGRSVEADYALVADLERIMSAERPDYVLHVAGVTKGTSYESFRLGNVILPHLTARTILRGPSSTTERVSWKRNESSKRSPVVYRGPSCGRPVSTVQEMSTTSTCSRARRRVGTCSSAIETDACL
ncbi:MAG: NAD-dependent epimerase/dehydratase family protein [Deltaproteobacteria bacterium]|nr:NAD-dependent epimerase/dehydratase family protein [Deltaproteobacteria bacterium]